MNFNKWLDMVTSPEQTNELLRIFGMEESGEITAKQADEMAEEFFQDGVIPPDQERGDPGIITFWGDYATSEVRSDPDNEFTPIDVVWVDADGTEHHIIQGSPEDDPDHEQRQTFDDVNEALDYIEEIGGAGKYFDVYQSSSGFTVVYDGSV
jgi:hypothetical protein